MAEHAFNDQEERSVQIEDLLYKMAEDIGHKQFSEFIRRLGIKESKFQELYNGKKDSKYELLKHWWKEIEDIDCSKVQDILQSVKRELLNKPTLRADSRIAELHKDEIMNERKIACFLYEFKRHASYDWMKTVRLSLKVPDDFIKIFEADFPDNTSEQHYRMLLHWKEDYELDTVESMIRKLKELNLSIPPSYRMTDVSPPVGDVQPPNQENIAALPATTVPVQPVQAPVFEPRPPPAGESLDVSELVTDGDEVVGSTEQEQLVATENVADLSGNDKQGKDVSEIIDSFDGNVRVQNSTLEFYEELKKKNKEIYEIKKNPKGHVLILSNTSFGTKSDLNGGMQDRTGGEEDVKLMKQLWEQMQCKVKVQENKKKQEMERILKRFSKKSYLKEANFCVVIIMSHGGLNEKGESLFFDMDGDSISATSVVEYFDGERCPSLKGCPKLFLFQACRGSKGDKGVALSSTNLKQRIRQFLKGLLQHPSDTGTDHVDISRAPTKSDLLVVYSTQKEWFTPSNCFLLVAGECTRSRADPICAQADPNNTCKENVSFRNETGSWFIKAIASVFMEKAKDTDVVHMLTAVKGAMSEKESNIPDDPDFHQCKQLAQSEDNLTKKFYLFPGHPEKKA